MRKKLILIAKALISKVYGREQKKEDEETARTRLQRLSEQQNARAQELIKRVEAQAQGELERQALLESAPHTVEQQRTTTKQLAMQAGITRWTGNGNRYLRQNIRNSEQLGGAATTFEIDPTKKLPKK